MANLKQIYLDNSTSARPSGEAVSQMLPFYTEKWGSPSQPHQKGQEVVPALSHAFYQIRQLLNAEEEDQVEFASSGGEAMRRLLFAVFEEYALKKGRNHFITSTLEDPFLTAILKKLEHYGASVTWMTPGPKGLINSDTVVDAITPRTALVVLGWASGLTGVVQPIEELASLCLERRVKLAVDASHILGKWSFEPSKVAIDFLIFHGEPLHAPKGVGGLWARKGNKLSFPPEGIFINVPASVALGEAAIRAKEAHDYLCTETARLKWHFEKQLAEKVAGAKILFSDNERLPHVLAASFPGLYNEALLFYLNRKGVCASIGGGVFPPLASLLGAMGVELREARSAISFSLSRETTEEEIDRCVSLVVSAHDRLSKQVELWR
jgi:cysteine desulfurase